MATPTRSAHLVSRYKYRADRDSERYDSVHVEANAINLDSGHGLTIDHESDMDRAPLVSTQEDFLQNLCDNVSIHFPELSFAMARATVDSTMTIPVLLITQRVLYFYPPYGMVSHI